MIVRRNSSAPDACSNCGEAIGRLETPQIWNQHIVCARCRQKLEASTPTQNDAAVPYARVVTTARPMLPQGQMIICPNPACGYIGEARKIPRGSVTAGCLLMLLFIITGILYLMFTSGYRIVCPKCGLQIREE